MRKRIIRALFLLIFFVNVFCVSAVAAADTTKIEFGEVFGKAGERVEVPVTITGNPGIAGFRFWVAYDTEALTLVSVEKGEALTSGTLKFDVDDDDTTITWFALTDITGNGELMTLVFDVSENTTGNYPLTVTYDPEDIVNASWQQVDCAVTDGKIKVENLNGLQYTVENNQVAIVDYTGNGGDLIIPATIEGLPVTSIGDYAFYNCSSLTSITIGNSVTSIGGYAFYNCSSLTSVTIPDSVTSISSGAFYGCTSLASITIPDSVTSIEGYAFYGCGSLTIITIPDGVTSIGYRTFYNCSSLTSVTIPDSVTSIGDSAFSGCTSLTSITIPDGVTSIGDDAFEYCTSLTSIIIPDSVTSIGNYAFSGCTRLTSVTIGNGVTSIGSSAFSGCNGLKHVLYTGSQDQWNAVSIGSYNTYLTGAMRHYNCSGDELTATGGCSWTGHYCSICDKPISATAKETAAHNFVNGVCTVCGVEEVWKYTISANGVTINRYTGATPMLSIPATIEGVPVVTIGGSMMEGASSLVSVTIPDSVTDISYAAFANCQNLLSVTLPQNLESIGSQAFYRCNNLMSLVCPDSLQYIYSEAFSDCDGLTSVSFNDGLKSIGSYAFEYCFGLREIVIPDSVTSIGNSAFYNCGLVDVTLGDGISYIYDGTFYGCSSLTDVTFGSNLKSIGDRAFMNCESLTEVVIPEGVTSIGSAAFDWCEGMTSLTLPASLKSVGRYAFYGCDALQRVNISSLEAWFDIEWGSYMGNPLYCAKSLYLNGVEITTLVVPESVSVINSSAFGGATFLTDIVFHNNVTSIAYDAFVNCTGLTELELPQSLKSISEGAFRDCTGLNQPLVLPEQLAVLGANAFSGCDALPSVALPETLQIIGKYCFYECGSLTSITIPSSVLVVDSYAFFKCDNLVSVVLENGVMRIGTGAFADCNLLNHVLYTGTDAQWAAITIASGNELFTDATIHCNASGTEFVSSTKTCSRYIYQCALCESDISIPLAEAFHTYKNGMCHICGAPEGLEYTIADNSVVIKKYTGKVSALTIPDTIDGLPVTSIGDNAFYYCTSLTSITIPDSVTSIGYNAFYYCSSLTSVTIPDSVTSIGSSAFFGCSSLTSVTIGNGVTSIGDYAFQNCSSLTSINIPVSVTSIGVDVISGCDSLYKAVYCGTQEQWDAISIGFYNEPLIEVLQFHKYENGSCAYCGGDEGWKYTIADGEATITGYTRTETDIVIPSTLSGYPVAVIGDGAFSSCTGLTSITIPDSVTSIKQWAFENCTDLACVIYCGTQEQWNAITIDDNNTPLTEATLQFHNYQNGTCTICKDKLLYTVIFKDEDGSELSKQTYHWGDRVTVPASPTKAADNTYTYTFKGWDKTVVNCAGNETYTATYTPKYIDYTVTFKNWDGTVLSTKTYHYGDKVSAPANPTRPNDSGFEYTFAGWDQAVVNCGGDAVYTATYSSKSIVPSTITSNKHTVSGGTISKIGVGTTVSTLLGDLGESSYVKVYQGEQEVAKDALIGTGMTVKIMDGNTVKATAVVVVTGDTNGDGKLTVTDMLSSKAHLLKKNDLQGAAGQAADTNGDGTISITDFIQMKAHVLGKSIVEPKSTVSVVQTSMVSEEPKAEDAPVVTMVLNYSRVDAIVPEKKIMAYV